MDDLETKEMINYQLKQSKNMIKILKALKRELKNNVNRFENIDNDNFESALKSIEETVKSSGKLIIRKKGPNWGYTGLAGSHITVDKNGIITECKLLGFWMNPEQLEESHKFIGKHISELQVFLKTLTPMYPEYNSDSFDPIVNQYVAQRKRIK